AVAAFELTTRTARARVVPPDAGEIIVGAWPLAGFHVRAAVYGRRRVLQPLRPARGEPRRNGRGRGGWGTGWPGVRATGPAVSLSRRAALRTADPSISLRRGSTPTRTRRRRSVGPPGRPTGRLPSTGRPAGRLSSTR